MKVRAVVAIVALAAVLAAFWSASRSPEASRPATTASAAPSLAQRAVATLRAVEDASAPQPSSNVRLAVRWGSGDLSRDRPPEGNPEGPMSFLATGEELVVLDQVGGHVAIFDRAGKIKAKHEVPRTSQDIARAEDGSLVVLDRLGTSSVTIIDPNGRKRSLSLPPAAGEPGKITGVFADKKDVYVEVAHGALVPIGANAGAKLNGRPSKDGELLITVAIASAGEGRVLVNAFDRHKGALRFARTIEFPRPVRSIEVVDSDVRGTILVGVLGGFDDAKLACLSPIDGHVTGRLSVPVSITPDESMRDIVMSADGTIVYAVRSDEGVEYRTATCP